MASHPPPASTLTESGVTMRSDSEDYDAAADTTSNSPIVSSSPSSTTPPLVLYKPPTVWRLLRGAAINLLLPFVNGLMLGFGELVANEAAYRLGWSGTKIFPASRSTTTSRRLGPGVEVRPDPVERRRRSGQELDIYTSLE